jgi:hypothetical protein
MLQAQLGAELAILLGRDEKESTRRRLVLAGIVFPFAVAAIVGSFCGFAGDGFEYHESFGR